MVTKRNIENIIVEIQLSTLENYEKIVYKLFEEHPDIDGIFASSDMIGISIIKVAKQLGKEIPKDLKIVGYDNITLSSLIVPSLTTIKQPIEQIGELVIQLLIDQIEQKEVSLENVLPITLVERETTG